jgi:sulfoquinovose isomerase
VRAEPPPSAVWSRSPAHRAWLRAEADRLLAFYLYRSIDPRGGFYELGTDGSPTGETSRHLVWTTRLVYCYSLAHMLGRPGSSAVVDHGLRSLRDHFEDRQNGGHFWIVDADGPVDSSKQAYGMAHVILAGAAASLAGNAEGDALLEEGLRQLEEHFWSEDDGLAVEEFDAAWNGPSDYRGANSNMHLVEALLGAAGATGDALHAERAARIAETLIHEQTAGNAWRVAEHYTSDWEIDRGYNRDDPFNIFRPFGSIVGHWFEWSRLLLHVRHAVGDPAGWMLDASTRLFRNAIDEGWDTRVGGLLYTVDFEGRPLNRDRYWWPVAEAICAAAQLGSETGDPYYQRWYRELWDFADTHLIDHRHGGWQHVLDPGNRPTFSPYAGKVDLFHALHACLLPLLPTDVLPTVALSQGRFTA